jgi:hypothetical protein
MFHVKQITARLSSHIAQEHIVAPHAPGDHCRTFHVKHHTHATHVTTSRSDCKPASIDRPTLPHSHPTLDAVSLRSTGLEHGQHAIAFASTTVPSNFCFEGDASDVVPEETRGPIHRIGPLCRHADDHAFVITVWRSRPSPSDSEVYPRSATMSCTSLRSYDDMGGRDALADPAEMRSMARSTS